jgi:hypothetical protein
MSNAPNGLRPNAGIFGLAALLLLPAAILFFFSAKLYYPTAQWDCWVLYSLQAIRAGTFAQNPYIIHPPLYLYLLALFEPLFHGGLLEGARLFNFVCYLLTGWLVFFLSSRLAGKKGLALAGFAGAALYFTSPLAVQGIFLLDLGDTSTVPLAAAIYFCALSYGTEGTLGKLRLAAVFALNLWAKLIHSFFLVLAAFAELVAGKQGQRSGAGISVLAAGLALFLLSWGIYASTSLHRADFWGPIGYFINEVIINYHRHDMALGTKELLFSRVTAAARVALWLWPLLLFWCWRLFKRGIGTGVERYLNFFILIFMVVSCVSKGTSNGFPKYHAVLLPALCALCGAYAAEVIGECRRAVSKSLLVIGVVVFAVVYISGDPLYTLNYSFKEALISGSGLAAAFWRIALQAAAASGAMLLIFLWSRRYASRPAAVAFAILAGGFIWQAALLVLQARRDYFTTYGYGTKGKAAAVEYLKENHKAGFAVAPNEFTWEFDVARVPFNVIGDECLMKQGCALGMLREAKTDFFVFGQACNTIDQIRYFRSLKSGDLGRKFSVVNIGDFWIYNFTGTGK